MLRLIKPSKIKKGNILFDKRSKDVYEVLKSSKSGFVCQSIYNRSRHEFTNADGLFVLSMKRQILDDAGNHIDEFVDINDFFVVLDDNDDAFNY